MLIYARYKSTYILFKVGSLGTRIDKIYGLCALLYSMETPEKGSCSLLKFQKYGLNLAKGCHGN